MRGKSKNNITDLNVSLSQYAVLLLFSIHVSIAIPAQPLPRHLEEIAFDHNTKTLILYGGSEYRDGTWNEPTYVSTWNENQWRNYHADGAGHRRAHALVYHPRLRMTFAIGGVMEGEHGKNTELYDVWGWNGKTWIQFSSSCPVREPEAVYDFANNQVLVYGHTGDYSTFELWAYQNHTWKKLSDNGPKPDGPYEVAYHLERHALIIPTNEHGVLVLYEWKSNQWKKVSQLSNAPPARNRYGLAYHEKEKALYLFGGRTDKEPFLNDFWKWDGSNWSQLIHENVPLKRAALLLEYADDRLVLYGGTVEQPGKTDKAGISNELWYYQNNTWSRVSGDWIEL